MYSPTPSFQPHHVERAFMAWRRGQLAPDKLLNTAMIWEVGLYRDELDYRLHSLIDSVIQSKLNTYRQSLGIPISYNHPDFTQNGITILRQDAVNHNHPLFAWSAMNVTLANPVTLNKHAIADAIRMQPSEFQQYVYQGLAYLTQELQDINNQMSQGNIPLF